MHALLHDLVREGYANMIFTTLFIACFIVIVNTARNRKLNSFQKVGMILLLTGCLLRIVLLTVDLLNLYLTNEHLIKSKKIDHNSVKLSVFISAPEILFTFPLFAISLDFMELQILLSSQTEVTPETYLRTNKRLKVIFWTISSLILFIFAVDFALSMLIKEDYEIT